LVFVGRQYGLTAGRRFGVVWGQEVGEPTVGLAPDGSGSHRAATGWPEYPCSVSLPRYRPELNPAEQFFRLLVQGVRADVVAVPVDFGWRDIGDWAALYDMMEHDSDGNAWNGQVEYLDTKDCLFFAPGKLVAAIGLRDLIVVGTDDVVLVMPRDRAQDVKKVLDQLT
jgi:hypothetical protein